MNVLIVNPIVYTSETKKIKRALSIKDTMIYDLCLAFKTMNHNVVLFAAEPFKPAVEEDYPFKVIWGKCILQWICLPHCFPYMPKLCQYIKSNRDTLDLIICSEVFSLNTLEAVLTDNKKIIIWHELAKHNAMIKKIPSKVWYNLIARFFMINTRVVARSEEAKNFIQKYCKKTSELTIDHGVNLDKFKPSINKEDCFVVCSQLIARKRIDGIFHMFKKYLDLTGASTKLYVIGEGDKRVQLEILSKELELTDKIIFTGKINHDKLLPYLAHAKAMLINTEKDNSMISIVESIAVGTPVVTTDVPLNSVYIKQYKLGLAKDWDESDLLEITSNNKLYVQNCLGYRETLSTAAKVKQFTSIL